MILNWWQFFLALVRLSQLSQLSVVLYIKSEVLNYIYAILPINHLKKKTYTGPLSSPYLCCASSTFYLINFQCNHLEIPIWLLRMQLWRHESHQCLIYIFISIRRLLSWKLKVFVPDEWNYIFNTYRYFVTYNLYVSFHYVLKLVQY